MKSRLRSVINRFPGMKRLLKVGLNFMLPARGVSTYYLEMPNEVIDGEAIRLRMAWKNEELPRLQRELVDRQLANYRVGKVVDVFEVLVKSLRSVQSEVGKMRVLEVGCSSGYYAEVFEIAGLNVDYTGCDYSEAFIALARQRYPKIQFDVQDATNLNFPGKSYDVVISGCCLLHIPEYQAAVAETARVTNRYAIFHRTPVVIGQPEKYYRKQAYGVETIEIHFNEPLFLQLLANNGLHVLTTHTLDESLRNGIGSAIRTYVCSKVVA